MDDVEKKEVELTTPSEATTEETKEQPKLSEESQTQVVDYKAKLEAEQLRREKAEARIVELKKEKKEVSTSQEREDLESRIEELESRLLSTVEEKTRELEMKSEQRRYSDAISSMSSSEDEAALIRHILENDIKPT